MEHIAALTCGLTHQHAAAALADRTDCMTSLKGFGPLENVAEFHRAERAEAPYCASRATE